MFSSSVGRGMQCASRYPRTGGQFDGPPAQQRKVFVGGLAHGTSTADLNEYFRRFGRISDSVVLRWPDGNSRGFGYVTFWEEASLLAVLQCRHVIDGQQVEVKQAVPTTNKLFVGRLPPQTTEADLQQYFGGFGTVSSAVVMMDASTGRTRGFGFVCFAPGAEGKVAINTALSKKHRLHHRLIDVRCAASYGEMAARERSSTATFDSGLHTPSDGDSSSEGPSSEPVECASSTASTKSSTKQHSRHKPALDLTEPRKVVLSHVDGVGAWTATAERARGSSKPVGINLKLGPGELFSDVAACKAHAGVPAKVHSNLHNTMPGVANSHVPGYATWSGGALGEECGHLCFEANGDFRRSLESLLKQEAARLNPRSTSEQRGRDLAQHTAGVLLKEFAGRRDMQADDEVQAWAIPA